MTTLSGGSPPGYAVQPGSFAERRRSVRRSASPRSPWRYGLHRIWRPLLSLPLDAAAVVLGFRAAFALRFQFGPLLRLFPVPELSAPAWGLFAQDLPFVAPAWIFMFHYGAGLYGDEDASAEDELLRIAKGCALGVGASLAFSFLYQRFANSRLMLLMAGPLIAALAFAARQASKRLFRSALRRFGWEASALVVGGGRSSELVCRKLERSGCSVRVLPSSSSVDLLIAELDRRGIEELVLAEQSLARAELLRLAEECEQGGVDLKIVPGLLEIRMGEVQIEKSLGLPMLRIHHISFSDANFTLKRLCDFVFCAAFFGVFALPLAVLCLIIKLDSPGPVLFKQRRCGYKGRPFGMYKFRTMVNGAEAMLDELRPLNERMGPVFKIKEDPRVTRVGRWLRRFSLDELPQFINVLRGEMSVVGPRPPLPIEVEAYDREALKRLNVLPGITGLWQVSGRADLDFRQMVGLDLYYLEHWSPGLDLRIILKTPAAILNSRGAY